MSTRKATIAFQIILEMAEEGYPKSAVVKSSPVVGGGSERQAVGAYHYAKIFHQLLEPLVQLLLHKGMEDGKHHGRVTPDKVKDVLKNYE